MVALTHLLSATGSTMRFAVLARVVVAAASVTLVAASTLERRELEDLRSPDTLFLPPVPAVRKVSTRAVVAPVP